MFRSAADETYLLHTSQGLIMKEFEAQDSLELHEYLQLTHRMVCDIHLKTFHVWSLQDA